MFIDITMVYYFIYQWDDTNDNPDDDAHDDIKSTAFRGESDGVTYTLIHCAI